MNERLSQRDDWHLTDALNYQLGRQDPFAAAVRATRMPMLITDPKLPDNPIVFANEAFQQLTGYGREEVIGRNCRFLQGPETNMNDIAQVRDAIAGGYSIEIDLLNYRKDGTPFWNALYLSPVRNESGEIQFFFASQLDVTSRVEAEHRVRRQKELVDEEIRRRTADLEAALEAKTILLHEVDHRVKNNLNMVGALLRLQARGIDDPHLANRLDSMIQRIDALASVHRQLHETENLKEFDIGKFTGDLAADVIGASGRTDIRVDALLPEMKIAASKAAPLGLILNEILTNAVKHAYRDGRSGTLKLRMENGGSTVRIRIMDDGEGLENPSGKSGLGQRLVRQLSRQIGGQVDWSNGNPGAHVTVTFDAAE